MEHFIDEAKLMAAVKQNVKLLQKKNKNHTSTPTAIQRDTCRSGRLVTRWLRR